MKKEQPSTILHVISYNQSGMRITTNLHAGQDLIEYASLSTSDHPGCKKPADENREPGTVNFPRLLA